MIYVFLRHVWNLGSLLRYSYPVLVSDQRNSNVNSSIVRAKGGLGLWKLLFDHGN